MNRKLILFYFIFFLIAFFVFASILFPGKEAATHLSSLLTARYSPLQIDIQSVTPEFPLGLKFENPKVILNEKTSIKVNLLKINFNLFSVFRKQKRIKIRSGFYDGTLEGSMTLNETGLPFLSNIALLLSGVKINDFRYKTDFADTLLDLEVAGEYAYFEAGDKKIPGKGAVHIENFSARMKDSLFNTIGLPLVDFSSIGLEFIQTKNKVTLTRCLAKGSIINVKLTGELAFGSSMETTILNLKGVILPDSIQLNRFARMASPGSATGKSDRKGIEFNISGTLGKPQIGL